ncbi:MAG: hypothetical protein GY851_05405, partial [bacterium]|nr:hypothetical protein [bacterium]
MPLPEKPPVIAARASNTGDDVFAVHRVLGEFRDSDTEATFRDSRLANDKSVAVIVMMASCAVFLFMSGVDYYTFREGAPAALPRVLVARLVCCVGTVACIVSVLRARRYTTLLRVSPLFVACVILPYSYIALAYATHSQGSVNMNVYLIVGALSPLLFQIPMRFALQGSLIIFVAAVCNHVFFIGTPIGSVVILISSMVASMALSASLAHGIQCGRRREYAGTRRVEALAESLRAEVERRKLTEQELQEHRENLESLVETQAEKLRESERKLQMAQRLDSVGQLAGGIAHDFNNLLMVMLGSTEMALSHPDLPPECHDDLDEARRAAQQGSQLTRQLLAFSSRQTVTPETLDVNEVARSLEKMLRRVIPESIAVSFDLEEDLDSVVADHGQLEQVIMNLIVNARDAMPDGGRVLLTTRAVQLDSLEEMRNPNAKRCSYVLLSVSDTGQGIPKDYLERIFEPFF